MSRNMNNIDRALRSFLVAPAAIAAAFVVGAGSIAGILLFALAAIMLATSAIGFCPLYKLLHLDTRGRAPLPH
jgi:Inner membrane protein YgaP-like, transmembrane domain